jgi:DNA-binding response OmpR family regulator
MGGTIMVVEDDEPSRVVLTTALERAGYQVAPSPNGAGVIDLIERWHPDLALVDLNLGGDTPDGFAVARAIRQGSDVAIMFLSAATALDDRLTGFDAGAEDFVVKPVSLAELLARIEAVLRRVRHGETGKLVTGDVELDETTHDVTRGGEPVMLTNVEFTLLRVLMRNRNRVMAKRTLLALAWGYEDFDENLVEVYVSSLRRKLEAHGVRIIHTVRGAGYVLRA